MHIFVPTIRRVIAIVLILLTILAVPALAESGFVRVNGARVYGSESLTGKNISINRYMLVDVLSVDDGVAKIRANGYTVYIAADMLTVFDEDDAREMEFSKDARVYAYPSTASRSARIAEGTKVNVLYTANGCAVVEKNGVMAYTYLSALEEPLKIIYDEFEASAVSSTLKVYSRASTSAAVIGTYKKGERFMVKAYTDKWALVEINGKEGCCLMSGLEKYVKPDPTADEIFADEKLTNEEKIFAYLYYEMDYPAAAACGILANIKCESTFRPTAWNASGGSYGICQWTGGRYTNLKNWCADNGYDHTTLEAQCRFLKYELENRYTKVHSYMKNVPNTAEGSYDAGYYYCYNFEVPANRGSVSIKRGNMAKDDFWPKYDEY